MSFFLWLFTFVLKLSDSSTIVVVLQDEEEEEFEDGDEDMEDDLDVSFDNCRQIWTIFSDLHTHLQSSKNTSSRKSTSGKKSTTETDARNFPDRQGIFTLYAYKGDLKNGMRANTTICLWRRDGQSLLQKYTREREGKGNAIHFSSTMVYSCWEDRRKDEYLEVRVKCLNNLSKDASRDSKVELLDIDTIEQTCIDEKYLELDLEPYVSYADRKKQEEQANGTQNTTQEEEASEGEE